jgi:microcystin degradation protein MlrC
MTMPKAIFSHVRAIVGPDVPIGAELDPHGHLTELKTRSADILVFFKEYPHTDIYERAVETVDLTVAMTQQKIRPRMSVHDLNMMSVFHTSREPMRGFVDRMQALEGKDGILSVSLIHGFPWGDCADLGSKVLVVTDDRADAGAALARKLGDEIVGFRDRLLAPYLRVDAAIDTALAIEGGPVVIADSADNPGGGSAGDSTFMLRRLAERGVASAAIGPLWDAGAVALCFAAGEGAHLPLRIGGKTSPASGDPFDANVEVLRCQRDAKMQNAFGKGMTATLGDVAVVRAGGSRSCSTRFARRRWAMCSRRSASTGRRRRSWW